MMKAKKAILSALIATQVLSMTALAAPDEAIKEFNKVAPIKQEVKHFQGEVKLFIIKDGEKVRVDQKMTDGLRVVNGRTCVGVRDLVNAIEGADVEWDGTNHIVDITYGGKTISYPVGKPLMWTDGKAVSIDVPAQIDPAISKTFLPIRNIAETLGFKVDWDNKAKEVVLTPGAGTGQTTTAQNQTRPTTPQSPAQNKNLAWVTASGQRIPKPEELPTARYKKNQIIETNSAYNIYPTTSDLTHNPDGSITYFKGTVLEYTSQAPFRKVDSVGQRPANWNIFKPNKNDARVGTAIFTKGHPDYDKEFQKREEGLLNKNFYIDYGFSNKILDYRNQATEISKEEYKQQHKNLNRKKSGSFGLREADFLCNSMDKIYDATGLVDISAIGISKDKFSSRVVFSLSPSYYITSEGAMLSNGDIDDYLKRNGDFIIDKAIISTSNGLYFIDIPDISYKKYLNNIKYNSKNLYIGSYMKTLLSN